jgi:hypothetical protein
MKPELCANNDGGMGAVLCMSCDTWFCGTCAFDHSRPQPGDSLYEQKSWEARQMVPAFFGRS